MISQTKPYVVNPDTTALDNYDDLKDHIRKIAGRLDWLLEELDKADGSSPTGHNWGAVGDLKAIAHDLENVEGQIVRKVNRDQSRARVYRIPNGKGRTVKVTVPED